MSDLPDPFLAQLSADYNTGLVRQFIPRINSTAQYRAISEEEFPKGCDKISGAFFVDYRNTTDIAGLAYTWGLQACMPADVTRSPWKSTRDRQDFSEELYLKVTLIRYQATVFDHQDTSFYKITLNTTAGYFELPNYMNNGTAGPLLDKDPNNLCGNDCETEGAKNIYNHNDPSNSKGRRQTVSTDGSGPLQVVVNKGPLLTVAMALFGERSFIPTRLAHSEVYASSVAPLNEDSSEGLQWPINTGACVDMAPLDSLLGDEFGWHVAGSSVAYCIRNTDGGPNGSRVHERVASWIGNFNYDTERLTNAFTAAAFLANQAWMETNVDMSMRSLTVTFDLGADTRIPVLSRAGLILISILLGLDILILLALAVYAFWSPRWTAQLDSFAMMRIGAAVADKLPLLAARNMDKVKVLDEIPGWIGDQSGENESVGKLGLGAPRSLQKYRRYACYEGYNERMNGK